MNPWTATGDLFLRPEVRWKGENEPMVFNFAAGTRIPVAFLLSTLACMAQKPQNDELAKPINMGVPEAMLDAGNRGAVELIPLLREHLTDKAVPRYELSGKWEQAEAAQIALAKLGEKKQQQQVACELAYGNLPEQSLAFDKAAYIGGWFAINHLAAFLPDSEYNSNRYLPEPGAPHGDGPIGTRQQVAVRTLDAMFLPGAPRPATEHPILASPRRSKEWLHYIDTHREGLTKLVPTGDGASDSEDYCENYLASLKNRPDSYDIGEDDGTVSVVTIEQRGFGDSQGNAIFNGRNVPIRSWTDSSVTVELPSHATGKLEIVKANSKAIAIVIHAD